MSHTMHLARFRVSNRPSKARQKLPLQIVHARALPSCCCLVRVDRTWAAMVPLGLVNCGVRGRRVSIRGFECGSGRQVLSQLIEEEE